MNRTISNSLVQQRIQDQEYKKHQERISSIISKKFRHKLVDNSYDEQSQCNHYKSKEISKQFRETTEKMHIKHHNSLLVDKIFKIRDSVYKGIYKVEQLQGQLLERVVHHQAQLQLFSQPQAEEEGGQGDQRAEHVPGQATPEPVITSYLIGSTPTMKLDILNKDAEKYLKYRKGVQRFSYFADPYMQEKKKSACKFRRIDLQDIDIEQFQFTENEQ